MITRLLKRRTASVIFIPIFFVTAFLFVAESRSASGDEAIVVYGIGYPPIKAESPAQARLMARRAAIVDAYRNALVAAGHQGNDKDEDVLYTGISGFVKDMTIISEEYLNNGSIRITAKAPVRSVTRISKTGEKRQTEKSSGPSKVTIDEWYKIIKPLVKIDEQ